MWAFLANVIVVAILASLYYLAQAAGWALCVAWLTGFFYCYVGYGCWKRDHEKPVIRDR